MYVFIGILGSVGVVGRSPKPQKDLIQIMDYFPEGAWEPVIVEIVFSLHMVTSIPIFHNIAKDQIQILLHACFRKTDSPKKRKVTSIAVE